MIIKIGRGASAEGLLRYLRRSDRSAEEQANARIFRLHRIVHIENAAARLDRAAAQSGLSKPIVHIIIGAERPLSDPEKEIAIDAVCTELGLEEHPRVSVVHDPDQKTHGTAFLKVTNIEHFHLAICAANHEGQTPPRILYSKRLGRAVTPGEAKDLPAGDVRSRSWDSFSQRRLMAVARNLEDRFGLKPLARNRQEQAVEKDEMVKISVEAQARWRREGAVSLLHRVDIAAAKAALHLPAWDDKIGALAKLGLDLDPVFSKSGELRGLRLVARDDPSIYCAASDLGSNYGRAALDRRSDRAFLDWYASSGRSSAAARPPRKRISIPSGPEAEYEAYAQQHARERQMLNKAVADLRVWRRKQRDAARARRETRWPQQRHRSARPLRAMILQSYRAECAEIDGEFGHQSVVLAQHHSRKLTYAEWLITQAQTSAVAVERLHILNSRSVPSDTEPKPAETAPSGAELAAAAEEQVQRKRAAEALAVESERVEAAITRQGELAHRLQTIGVTLVSKADAENRRVEVEDATVSIDGRALHTAVPGLDDPVLRAGAEVAERQRLEIKTLPLLVEYAPKLPPQPEETPRIWLDRLFRQPQVTRWLDKNQIATVQRRWDKEVEGVPHDRLSASEAAPPPHRPAPIAPQTSRGGRSSPPHMPAPASPTQGSHQQKAAISTGEPRQSMPPPSTRRPRPQAVGGAEMTVSTTTPQTDKPRDVPARVALDQVSSTLIAPKARAADAAQSEELPGPAPTPPGSISEEQPKTARALINRAPSSSTDGASLVNKWLVTDAAASKDPAQSNARDAAAARVQQDPEAREIAAMLDEPLIDLLRQQASAHQARKNHRSSPADLKVPQTEPLPAPEVPTMPATADPGPVPASEPTRSAPADRKQPALRQQLHRLADKEPGFQ